MVRVHATLCIQLFIRNRLQVISIFNDWIRLRFKIRMTFGLTCRWNLWVAISFNYVLIWNIVWLVPLNDRLSTLLFCWLAFKYLFIWSSVRWLWLFCSKPCSTSFFFGFELIKRHSNISFLLCHTLFVILGHLKNQLVLCRLLKEA